MLTSRTKGIPSLDRGEEAAVGRDVPVRHTRRIERKAGIAVAVEEDETPGGMRAFGKEMDGFAGGERGAGGSTRNVGRRVHTDCGAAKKIDGGLGQDDFHDGFAVARARNAAGFRVRIAAAADQRRIADAAGKLAAGSPRGSAGEEAPVGVDGNGADGSLLVAAMMLGGVFVGLAFHPGFPLGFADEFLRLAKLDALFFCKSFRAVGDEHHVRAVFQDSARELNGILDAVQISRRAGAKRGPVHHDGVTFDVPVQIEVRAVAGVEDGIVFEDNNGGFDGVESRSASRKNGPAGSKRAMAAGFASVNRFVRNVPRTAVNNQRWFHDQRIAEKNENRKQKFEKARRRKKIQTKKSRRKRRKPRKRRIAGRLTRRRGNRVMDPTKETGMALRRDFSRSV